VHKSYGYVGPADLTALVGPEGIGQPVGSPSEFAAFIEGVPVAEFAEPFTFVVDLGGLLRLAPRRSEHVVCAGGERVLAAGEIGFELGPEGWAVVEVSNQSTGYCPNLACWAAVAAAVDRGGLARPAGFTQEVVFRRCPECGEVNVVREGFLVCAFCESGLPAEWNIDAGA
jgi:hypothetical protein